MIKEERYKKILDLLEEKPYYSVETLAKKLYVSKPTIRRDLTEMAKRDLVARHFGGVGKIAENRFQQYPFGVRLSLKKKEKRELCKKAVEFIKDGDVIFMDSSTTLSFFPELLANKKRITVVSNSLMLCHDLSINGVKTFCIGGEVYENTNGTLGTLALEYVSRFNYDIAFFSSAGVNDRGYIVDSSFDATTLRKKVLENSKKKVYIFESEKVGIDEPFVLDSISKMNYIVTNKSLPDSLKMDKTKVILTDK